MKDEATRSQGPVTVERYDDARIVTLHGEHDVSEAGLVREILAAARSGDGAIFVDLSAAAFIDSTIAVALIEAYRVDTPPRLIFDTIGFGTGLPIYERLEDAAADTTVG